MTTIPDLDAKTGETLIDKVRQGRASRVECEFVIAALQQRIAELEAELVRVSERVNSDAVNELQRLGQEIERP